MSAKHTVLFWIVALFVPAVSFSGHESKDSYPSRPITLVVQSSPGGGSDFTSRTIAKEAEKYLGQRINVINKPGGSGSVGMGFVATAKPDGYTIGFVPVELSILKHLGYTDIAPDKFELIMRAITTPAAVSVRSDSPYRTLNDLVKDARKRPGKISLGNAGVGGPWHIAALALEQKTDVTFKHVPFDGSSMSLTALLGGHLDVVVSSPAEATPHVQAGHMRVLGILDKSRFSPLPEVPTAKEQGFDVAVMAWGGFAAPKGTAHWKVKILHDAFKQAFDEPAVFRAFTNRGFNPSYLSGPQFTEFAINQSQFFAPLVATLGFKK